MSALSGRSWILIVAVVGSLLGLLLLADRCEGPPPGGGDRDGDFFDAAPGPAPG